jgi:hypothetical protein
MVITPQVARLQFVLHFTRLDLATLADEAWYDLQDDLLAFLTLGTARRQEDPQERTYGGLELRRTVRRAGGLESSSSIRVDLRHETCALVRDEDFPLPDTLVRTIQTVSTQMLEGALAPPLPPLDGLPVLIPVQWAPVLEGPVQMLHSQIHPGEGTTRVLKASPRDAFLFLLSEILTHEAIDRIQRCPDCRTLFYRLGKQKYCSTACTNRAGVRQWRQRQAGTCTTAVRARTWSADSGKPAVGAKVKGRRRPRTERV